MDRRSRRGNRRWATAVRGRRVGAAIALVLLVPLLTACEPPPARITTDPTLFPAFDLGVSDYVSRCDASDPVAVSVVAAPGTTVAVGGQAPRTGTFTAQITRDVGQRFTLVVNVDGHATSHHVRCLPADFPHFDAVRSGRPQAAFYVTLAAVGIGRLNYPTVFDTNGVPVWWGAPTAEFFAFPLNGGIAWNVGPRIEEHRLDGSVVRSYSTVNHPMDFHDLVFLPNGNRIMVTFTSKPGTDLSSWGGPANATIVDHIVQEITPANQVVWSWRTSDHISVNETTLPWQQAELADPGGPFSAFYDPYHWNSAEWVGDGVVLSFRHLDAVIKVTKSTGAIAWKLGGTARPQSLTVVGDPVVDAGGTFGGQHDARILSDGTLSLYDNGTGRGRSPREVVYALDLAQRRATLLRSVTDQVQTSSFCCGSARVLPGGNVVIGWGGNDPDSADVTESTRTGVPLFELSFTDRPPFHAFAYRGTPVLPGQLSLSALRMGMDAQFG